MSETNPIQAALRLWGQERGLTRKASTWYLRQEETVAVVNLQRSQWGAQYYINVAFWLLPLGETDSPKENKCHVRTRLERLLPGQAQLLESILDLDSDVDDSARLEELRTLLGTGLMPILRACATIQGLRSSPEGQLVRRVSLVNGPAHVFLGE